MSTWIFSIFRKVDSFLLFRIWKFQFNRRTVSFSSIPFIYLYIYFCQFFFLQSNWITDSHLFRDWNQTIELVNTELFFHRFKSNLILSDSNTYSNMYINCQQTNQWHEIEMETIIIRLACDFWRLKGNFFWQMCEYNTIVECKIQKKNKSGAK